MEVNLDGVKIGTQVISGAKIGHGRSQRCQWAALSISQSAPQPGNIHNVHVHVHGCEIVNLTNSFHLKSSGRSPIQGFLQWKSWYV